MAWASSDAPDANAGREATKATPRQSRYLIMGGVGEGYGPGGGLDWRAEVRMSKAPSFYQIRESGASQFLRNKSKKAGNQSSAYVERVNRAIDFILQNLDQSLQLEVVAQAAGFSPFHFHRIFRLLVGESLNEFVKRVRLERVLAQMSRRNWATRRRPSLTDIAFACGFGSSSDFSRCFKQRYGVAPSRFDI